MTNGLQEIYNVLQNSSISIVWQWIFGIATLTSLVMTGISIFNLVSISNIKRKLQSSIGIDDIRKEIGELLKIIAKVNASESDAKSISIDDWRARNYIFNELQKFTEVKKLIKKDTHLRDAFEYIGKQDKVDKNNISKLSYKIKTVYDKTSPIWQK